MTMEEIKVTITDNSAAVKSAMKDAILRALEKCGLVAEGYAKKLCDGFKNPTGNLRNSITHVVDDGETAVYIGTYIEYAIYVELGTGIYAEGGGGRPTPWVYQDAHGRWHWTRGNEAQPFLKPALEDHKKEYQYIIKSELGGK